MSPVREQLLIFLWAIPVGASIMFVYDLFRILRLVFSHKDWVVFVEDVCFFILAGMLTWRYLLENCRGELRAFVFAAEVIGAVLWFVTCGKIVMAVAGKLIRLLRFLFRNLVLRPLTALMRGLVFLCRGFLRLVWHLAKLLGAEKWIAVIKKAKIKVQNAKNHLQEGTRSVYNSYIGLIMPFGKKALNSEQEVESGAQSIIPSDR